MIDNRRGYARWRGYCPIHEWDRQLCGLTCFDAHQAFTIARIELWAYWRDRRRGVRRKAA